MHPIGGPILAGALAALSCAAAADDLGRITAFLDGESMTWHTITMQQGDKSVATASFEQGARLAELYIQGHPEPRFSTRDMFSIEVRYQGTYVPGATPMSVDVMHIPEGMGGPFWTSRGATAPATIDIVELDVWGNFGRMTASFEAELCFREIISSATDPSKCRAVTGVIETELFVE